MHGCVRFLLVGVVCSLFSACANLQVVPPEQRSIQKVHEINLTKNEIYDKSLEWMAQAFHDSKSVIELKDRENGKIIGKGMTSFTNVVAEIPCRFTMVLETKDGKYRTSYNNFVGMWGEYRNLPRDVEEQGYMAEITQRVTAMDDSLYSYLKGAKKNENW